MKSLYDGGRVFDSEQGVHEYVLLHFHLWDSRCHGGNRPIRRLLTIDSRHLRPSDDRVTAGCALLRSCPTAAAQLCGKPERIVRAHHASPQAIAEIQYTPRRDTSQHWPAILSLIPTAWSARCTPGRQSHCAATRHVALFAPASTTAERSLRYNNGRTMAAI